MTGEIHYMGIRQAAPEPLTKIQPEDIMKLRVVRHHDDVIVVLDNPRTGLDGKYHRNIFNDEPHDATPKFAVTHKGFQFYAETSLELIDRNNPDSEVRFHGRQATEKHRLPSYQITVKI